MNPLPRWLLALAFCSVVMASAAEPRRFNVLFCFADDWGRYASAYARLGGRPNLNQVIKTPNIDRVAREGVLFRNAFVPAPSCTPCRSSILSGRYFWNTGRGAILQGAVWDSSIPSFPLLIRDSGYHIGKSHKVWSPGTPADAPFGGQKYGFEKAGVALNNFSENATKMVAEGASVADARSRLLAQVRANFDAFLAARSAGQPWLYWFGPTTTHRTWIKGSGRALWNIDPDSLRGKMPAALPDVPEVREDVADYLGESQAYDAYVGVLLDVLEKSGELDRTVVVISGDHGMPGVPDGKCNLYDLGVGVALLARWPGAPGGRIVDDFVNLMDLAPTFLEVAGASNAPAIQGRSIVAQLKSDRGGLIDPSRNFVVTGRERHVGVAREGNLPYPMRALRTPEFLYIRNFAPDRWPMGAPLEVSETNSPTAAELERETRAAFPDMDASPTKAWLVQHRTEPLGRPYFERAFAKRPPEELYDLRLDPEQTNNVAGQAAYRADQLQLSQRLLSLLEQAGDPRVTGDKLKFDRPPFTDPEPASVPRRRNPPTPAKQP